MKSRSYLPNLLIVLLALSPLFYLMITWKSIPELVTLKFHNNPAKEQNKDTLIISTLILSFVSMGIYFLLRNIKRIDPKVKNSDQGSGIKRLGLVIAIFLIILNYVILLIAAKALDISDRLVFPFIGLFVSVLGNYMINLKQNYFAGIRLPWTLNDTENWRKTHRLGGKLWFWGGLGFIVTSLILPLEFLKPVFIGLVIILAFIPCIYSYRLFKSKA